MTKNPCPSPKDPQYSYYEKLVNLVGDKAAFRIWNYFESLLPGSAYTRTLDQFDSSKFTLFEKEDILKKTAGGLVKHGNIYKHGSDTIDSVSRRLDDFSEIAYTGTETGEQYQESGTKIHALFERIAKGETETEALKWATDNGIPSALYYQLKNLQARLSSRGKILSEQVLYTGKTPEAKSLAGTSDIILLTNDGKIEIYDLKTINLTPSLRSKMKPGQKEIWGPEMRGGKKGKRYSSQLLTYGRMVEWTLRQPVSDHFIVPIEVEFNEDDTLKGYKQVKVLDPENIRSWGHENFATGIVDQIFHEKSSPGNTVSIIPGDTSGQLFTSLTGAISGKTDDYLTAAKQIHERNLTFSGESKGFYADNKFHRYADTTNKGAQIQQIVDYLVANPQNDLGISESVQRYLSTGDSNSLRASGIKSEQVIKLLSNFKLQGYNVNSLNGISGFEDKVNWLLINKENEHHLIYVGRENLNKRFSTNGTLNNSLFGKHIDKQEAINLSFGLENTFADARKLEGSIIMMKLRESNPNIRFHITGVIGTTGYYAGSIDHQNNLKVLQRMYDHPILKNLLSEDIVRMLGKKELVDPKSYKSQFIDVVGSYLKSVHPSDSLQNLGNAINNYAADATKKAELKFFLQDEIARRKTFGDSEESNYELYLLSGLLLELDNIIPDLTPVSWMNSRAGMPQNIANQMIGAINNALNTSINKLSQMFRNDYKNDFEQKLDALFKSKSLIDRWVVDPLTGDTPRYYQNLFKKERRDVINSSGEKTNQEIHLFEFWDEDSPQFNALNSEEQSFIRYVNDTLEKFAKRSNISWTRGKLPLVRSSSANTFWNAFRNKDPRAINNAVKQQLVDIESNFGFGDNEIINSGNMFAVQSRDGKREEMMGIDASGAVNMEDYMKWSTNIEAMSDVFVIQSLRNATLNNVGGMMHAANSILNWYKSNLIGERLDPLIDFTKTSFEANVNNRDVDAGTKENMAARLLGRLSALTMIAARPSTALISYVGSELTLFSQSISNSLVSNGRFTAGSLLKAKGIVAAAAGGKAFNADLSEKVNLLMREFRLFNEDVSSLLNGYHRSGDKYLFTTKHLFSLMNGADWMSRSSLMVAQMIDDGTWDAYSVVDGKLVYDQDKDERFGTKSKYSKSEQEALKKTIGESVGYKDNKLVSAYDDQMRNSVRGMANYLLGGFDRETRAMINFRWWGKLLVSMKNWLPAKIQRWTNPRFESQMIGEYVFQTNDAGENIAVWKGEQIEGIFMSLNAMTKWIKDTVVGAQSTPLTKIQKDNLIRATGDLALIALSTLAAIELGDDDEDKIGVDDWTANIIRRGAEDLTVIYNIISGDDFLWTSVPLEYLSSVAKTLTNALTGDVDLEKIGRVVPVSRQVEELNYFIEEPTDLIK